MKTNPNDTAFPIINPVNNEGHPGLSKREYFAALAMQGFCSDKETKTELIASLSVQVADALIVELTKERGE